MRFTVHNQDCREAMAAMDAASIDAIVTDPPYGLSFMGKGWDHGVPGIEFWTEAIRVAKPGTHLLAFGGTRTFHRLTCAIEDAGWEIRDCIMWVYGSGFPKSHNLKDEWSGWGTALKPAWEPIIVARKPLVGTVAENVLRHGTGGINVDGCRVGYESKADKDQALSGDAFKRKDTSDKGWSRPWMKDADRVERMNREAKQRAQTGRWPANLIHDGSDEVVRLFPQTGPAKSARRGNRAGVNTDFGGPDGVRGHNDDGGSAARFFYCAKASKADRGCDNNHPTVKPTDLMRYLCRLVTPPHGTVFDPFCGSGSTGKAAVIEGFDFIGCELDQDYARIAKSRIAAAMPRDLFIGAGP